MADNVAVTAGSGTTIAADEVTDGTLGTVKVQYVKLMDGTLDGTTKAAVSASGLKVDLGADNDVVVTNAGTFAVQESGGALTALQIIDDWDESDRAKVNPIVGQAGVAAGAGTIGATTQRVTIATDDSTVGLLTGIDADTSNMATSLGMIDDWDNAASDGASVSGDTAHDAADAGEPVKIGAKAVDNLYSLTPVVAGDRTNAFADLDGAIIMRDYSLGDLVAGYASNTDGASTEVIAAQGAGIRVYLTDITISNTSATDVIVEIKDGSTTKWVLPVPAGSGVVKAWRSPIASTTNTAWNFDASAAATTLYFAASGFRSKV